MKKENNQQPEFVATYTIVCPQCKQKQNGIMKGSVEGFYGFFIQCCMPQCRHIIMEDQLEEVTRKQVKGPSDLNRW